MIVMALIALTLLAYWTFVVYYVERDMGVVKFPSWELTPQQWALLRSLGPAVRSLGATTKRTAERMQELGVKFKNLTWTCHVCGDERPDRFISVYSRTIYRLGGRFEAQENIRYCNDRPDCIAGAPSIHHVKEWS